MPNNKTGTTPKSSMKSPVKTASSKPKALPKALAKTRTPDDEVSASDPDFMTSLARGLEVIAAFSEHRRSQTISQISQRTGLSRASARRCLHTLTRLGFVAADAAGNGFVLRPKVLTLGYAYLSSATLTAAAQPLLDRLRDRLQESCSLGVLDGNELVYIARAETRRIMSIALQVGSRLPAHCTSMGRVLLADLPAEELNAYLERTPLPALTHRTITDRKRLLDKLESARRKGYAVVDQELELGLRSIAVPVRDHRGRVIAAINIGSQAARSSLRLLEERFLPELLAAARELDANGTVTTGKIRALSTVGP